MALPFHNWDEEDDSGLPDAAFTDDELAAGVQHIARTGDPNARESLRPKTWTPMHLGSKYEESPEVANKQIRFENFSQAKDWAKVNPGRSFSRTADGIAFEAKPLHPKQRTNESRIEINSEIKTLCPHLHDILTKSGSGTYDTFILPFNHNIFDRDASRLTLIQLRRLRLLIAIKLEGSQTYLNDLRVEMRRFPHMRGGEYGEDLFEGLVDILIVALIDIDNRLG